MSIRGVELEGRGSGAGGNVRVREGSWREA